MEREFLLIFLLSESQKTLNSYLKLLFLLPASITLTLEFGTLLAASHGEMMSPE